MSRALKAGATYFAAVFLLGFVLGTLRVLWLAPRLGAVAAVVMETPVILAGSWIVCGWCVRRLEVGAGARDRLVMGCGAFTLLMAAETLLSVLVFGQTLAQHFAGYATLAGALGLGAQLVFAAVPLVQARLGRA